MYCLRLEFVHMFQSSVQFPFDIPFVLLSATFILVMMCISCHILSEAVGIDLQWHAYYIYRSCAHLPYEIPWTRIFQFSKILIQIRSEKILRVLLQIFMYPLI